VSTPFTVRLAGARLLVDRHRAVLSSVPDRLRAAEQSGDVALVDGSTAGWTQELASAVRNGARGVLVAGMGITDGPDAVSAAGASVRDAGVVVVVDRLCAMNRTWREVAPDWRRDAATAAVLDSTASTSDEGLDQVLLEQLALVRMVVGRPDRLETAGRSSSTYQVQGTAGAVRISLSAVRSSYATLAVDLVGAVQRRRAEFDRVGLAGTALISRLDRLGTHTEPLRYESPHRVGWLELHAALTGDDVGVWRSDLDDAAEEIAWARPLLDLA
jgi:hypothetical protein